MGTWLRFAVMLAVLGGLPYLWVAKKLPAPAQQLADRCVQSAKEAVDWDHIDWRKWGLDKACSRVAQLVRGGESAASPVDASSRRRSDVAPLPPATAQASPSSAPPSPPTSSTAGSATALGDRLESRLAQLRRLGAAEYSLRRWGAGGLVRFCCEMPLAEGAAPTVQFEAVAVEPTAAVEQVLADVERWCEARNGASSNRLASRSP
jgi:hypothetical protein